MDVLRCIQISWDMFFTHPGKPLLLMWKVYPAIHLFPTHMVTTSHSTVYL